MLASVANQHDREQRADDCIADPEVDRHRSKTISRREIAGEKGRDAYGEVTGELVEADREAARLGPHQIDLHDHRHRPGKTLINTEQNVGRYDPTPTRSPN